jgi:hypothetical protein
LNDRKGATLPMMAAGMMLVIAAVGSAVDLGRIYLVRSQMQAGVDAAALAGARSFGLEDERNNQVNSYFSPTSGRAMRDRPLSSPCLISSWSTGSTGSRLTRKPICPWRLCKSSGLGRTILR